MKPVQTPECNRTLTLRGGTAENDLPAQLILAYDHTAGETEQDAKPAFVTTWQPSETEARRLEAGACVQLTVWAISDPRNPSAPPTQPPLTVAVTQAVVPERELIDRGHVNRAIGHLYAALSEGGHLRGPSGTKGDEIEPSAFADLWLAAVNATRAPEDGGAGDPEQLVNSAAKIDALFTKGAQHAAIVEGKADISTAEFETRLGVMLDAPCDIAADPTHEGQVRVTSTAHGCDIYATGFTRRQVIRNLRAAIEKAAIESEHTERPS